MTDVEVSLDGQAWKLDRAGLLAGTTITIPGGSALLVRSVRRRWWSVALRDDLLVELDGVPLPGSDGHPRTIGRRAAILIALVGIVQALGIVLWVVSQHERSGPEPPWSAALASGGPTLLALAALAALGLRLPVLLAAILLGIEVVASVRGASPAAIVILALVVVHLVGAWNRMRPRASTPSLAKIFE